MISARRFAVALQIDMPTLAQLAGVDRNAVRSERMQRFLQDAIKVIQAAADVSGDVQQALSWYRNEPLPALLLMTQGLRTTPVAFLRDGLDASFAAPAQRQFRPPSRRTLELSVKQRNALTEALRNIIAEGYSECPMKDVAEKLGYKYTYLRYWFETECRQISKLHRQWILAQRLEKERRDAALATQVVRALYSTQAHVTRRHTEKCLRNVGLSLASPVVREAANRVKDEHFSACRTMQHSDSNETFASDEQQSEDSNPSD